MSRSGGLKNGNPLTAGMQKFATCKGCGASTQWIVSEADKWILCERKEVFPEECEIGTVLVGDDGKTIKVGYTDPDPGVTYFECHWGNCKKAEQFKKKVEYSPAQRKSAQKILAESLKSIGTSKS